MGLRLSFAFARACAWVGVAALAAAAWLASRGGAPATLAGPAEWLLVDVSDSMRRARPDFAAQLTRLLAEQARAEGRELAELGWIAYGNGAREFRGSAASRALAEIDGSASDLALALELLERRLPPGGVVRVRLYSDGGSTGRDPRPALERLANSGVGLEWLEVPERTQPELYLAEVRAPSEAESGQRVVLQARVHSFGDGVGALRVALGGRTPVRREFPVADGQTSEIRLDAGPLGAGAEEVLVELEGTPVQRWRAPIALAGERRALHRGGAALSSSLRWVHGSLGEELARLDVLVSSRAGPAPEELGAVLDWLRRGGLWVQFATPERGLEPAEHSALEVRWPSGSAQSWVALLDASGSMRGERWARLARAWSEVARLLPPGSTLETRLFAAELGPPLTTLPSEAPGGPTALVECVEQLLDGGALAGRALLVISDGEDRLGASALARASAWRARHAGPLVAIATSTDSSSTGGGSTGGGSTGGGSTGGGSTGGGSTGGKLLLAALAGGPERVLDAGNLMAEAAERRLLECLRGALQQQLWQDQPARVAGADLRVRTHLSARPVAGARVLAQLESGAPLVAERALGLGRVLSLGFPPEALEGAGAAAWLASWCEPRTRGTPRLTPSGELLLLEDAPEWGAAAPLETLALVWRQRDGSEQRRGLTPLSAGRQGWWWSRDWITHGDGSPPELRGPQGLSVPLSWPLDWSPEARPDRPVIARAERVQHPARPRANPQPRSTPVVLFLILGLVALSAAAAGGFFHPRARPAQAP